MRGIQMLRARSESKGRIMKVDHCVLIKKGEAPIGRFRKTLEMPCLPPIGTLVYFGSPERGFPQRVKELSFFEETGTFQAFYEIELYAEMDRLQDHIDDSFFPKRFVNKYKFSVDWIDEDFEDVRKKLESA